MVLDDAAVNPALRKAALKTSETQLVHDARVAGLEAREAAAVRDVESAEAANFVDSGNEAATSVTQSRPEAAQLIKRVKTCK